MRRRLTRDSSPAPYDPATYWNHRPNPNNEAGVQRDRVDFDVAYIQRSVDGEQDLVLELGPGVGRTFGAYGPGQHVTSLDLSRIYREQLAELANSQGIDLDQRFLADPADPFPFGDSTFSVAVASQVLLHVPPDNIRHTMSELVRVSRRTVAISAFRHGEPIGVHAGAHDFNHDYITIATDLGCALHDVISHEGRILFNMTRRADATANV